MALSTISTNTKITAATLNGVINVVNSLQSANPKAYITTTYQSGTNWYRKWSDGWIEQGGTLTKGYNVTVSFNLAYTTVDSINVYASVANNYGANDYVIRTHNWTVTGFNVSVSNGGGGTRGDTKFAWYACRILTFHSKRTQFSEKEIAQNERIFYWSNFFGRIPS